MTETSIIATQTGPADRDGQFQAVQGGTEIASGPTLLIEAYAVIWCILLGFLLVGWRRQSRLEAKISELEQAIARARTTKEEAP
jgi:CcmD family protein